MCVIPMPASFFPRWMYTDNNKNFWALRIVQFTRSACMTHITTTTMTTIMRWTNTSTNVRVANEEEDSFCAVSKKWHGFVMNGGASTIGHKTVGTIGGVTNAQLGTLEEFYHDNTTFIGNTTGIATDITEYRRLRRIAHIDSSFIVFVQRGGIVLRTMTVARVWNASREPISKQ